MTRCPPAIAAAPTCAHNPAQARRPTRSGDNRPVTTGHDDLLDAAVLEDLRETMGREAFDELQTTFIEQIELVVGRLKAAGSGADHAAMERASHELAGLAGTMGALRLADAARRTMRRARDGTGDPGEMYRELEGLAHDTVLRFRDYASDA